MAFYDLPFEPYAPIRRQMLMLLRAVNAARKRAGFRAVPTEVLPLRRRIVKPFGEDIISLSTSSTRDVDLTEAIEPEPE